VNLVAHDINFDADPQEMAGETIAEESKNEMFLKTATLALFDYLRKSRSRGFVLSLSGGADSTTCAVLVAEMVRRGLEDLGLEQFLKKLHAEEHLTNLARLEGENLQKAVVEMLLTCAYQSTVNSSRNTFESARKLAADIGAVFHHWYIDDEVQSYTEKIETTLGQRLTWEKDDIALQNIQARARSPIIWMLANIQNSLLLVTSNRSEADLGYATMDGDMSGSIAPIAAVDKDFIRQWLVWAEEHLSYTSLRLVNSLDPSAELRPQHKRQTDEEDLMPYAVVTAIERLGIRDRLSPLEIFNVLAEQKLEDESLLKLHIKKFFVLWSKNQWKRERTAPSFHMDDFNVDPRTWCRFPILSGGFTEELEQMEQAG
jgi:NAD+ synthase (glutamine-hydrolysing)